LSSSGLGLNNLLAALFNPMMSKISLVNFSVFFIVLIAQGEHVNSSFVASEIESVANFAVIARLKMGLIKV
jgi:hypothetical protein